MTDDQTPLERLNTAIQDFINEIDDEAPVLLDSAVLVWESMIYTDDGDVARKINYANAGRASMSATVGLLQAGSHQVLTDLTGNDDDD